MKLTHKSNLPVVEMFQEALRLHHAGKFSEAEKIYRAILVKQPKHADALCMIGVISGQIGQVEAGIPYLEKAATIDPAVADYHSYLADAYRTVHRPEAAIKHYRKVLELSPGHAKIHNNLGAMLERSGDMEGAIEQYNLALVIKPESVKPHFMLAEARRYNLGDPLFQKIEKLLQKPDLSITNQAHLHFALAKMYDDCDEYEQAFAHVKIANELDPVEFHGKALVNLISRIIKVFDTAFFKARPDFGRPSELPIFVIGTPRSGKSLAEHILSRYPGVAAVGERKEFGKAVENAPESLETISRYPEWVPLMDQTVSRQMAGEYLKRLHKLVGDAKFSVETMPANFLRLGMMQLLFPKARIIHCRRDPLDIGLACYFRNLNNRHAYAGDLKVFGEYYRQYQKMMAHWRAVLPTPMLEVDYEALVADPEAEGRRIVEFCGLEWDPACLENSYRATPVQTAPGDHGAVSNRFVGRWRHYERFLGPLKDALAEGGPENAKT